MEMSDVQIFWAQLQLLWPFPRNRAQGFQQEHQHQKNPFKKTPKFTASTNEGLEKGSDYSPSQKDFSPREKDLLWISF